MQRYIRNHSSIDDSQQKRIENLKLAIVGLGGLGGYVLENLVRLGVKDFALIDKGRFEESNLNRQILSTEKNIGEDKTEAAKRRVKNIDRSVKVKTYSSKLDKTSKQMLEDIDIVFDCLDSIESRFDLEYLCDKLKLPLIHGAIRGYYGEVGLSTHNNRIFDKIYKKNVKEKEFLGNLPMTCMITASIQVNLLFKYLFESYNESELILIDVKNMEIENIKLI